MLKKPCIPFFHTTMRRKSQERPGNVCDQRPHHPILEKAGEYVQSPSPPIMNAFVSFTPIACRTPKFTEGVSQNKKLPFLFRPHARTKCCRTKTDHHECCCARPWSPPEEKAASCRIPNQHASVEHEVVQHIRRLPTSLLVQRLQGLVECGDTHTTSSLEAATGRRRRSGHGRGAVGVTPAAEDALEIPRSTLENDCGDWHKRPVLHTSGEDAVLLRKVQRVAERDILRLRFGPDNDVKLKEGIEDVDTSSLQVLLREG